MDDMYLVNNELMNTARVQPVALPQCRVDEVTPFTGTLEFYCENRHHMRAVEHFLTARRASALTGLTGRRLYVKADGALDERGEFPRRVVIKVQFVDDPGPAIIG